jgi:hypothetical protein
MEETDEAKLEIYVMPGSPLKWGYLPTVSHFNSLPGSSQTGDLILHKIVRHGLGEKDKNYMRLG